MIYLFWALGSFGVFSFYLGIYFPIVVSVGIFLFSASYLILLASSSRVGPLSLLLFLVFLLPFIHVVPYLWFDFLAESPQLLWGLQANPYMVSEPIIEIMAMIGAIGAIGVLLGSYQPMRQTMRSYRFKSLQGHGGFSQTLSPGSFFLLIAVAVAISWLNAPVDTIFSVEYTKSKSMIDELNFPSIWMFSYVLMLLCLADSIFEGRTDVKRLKTGLVLAASGLIVVWFQLLRGDRESLPAVVAGAVMYSYWARTTQMPRTRSSWRPYVIGLGTLFCVHAVSHVTGIARSALKDISTISELPGVIAELIRVGAIRFDSLLSGTWSGALLTPLSVAGAYVNGVLEFDFGQTYLDLAASIIPGFLADFLGYMRPIDGSSGPAWKMTYGIGGTHAIVVPFMSFGMSGVLLIVAIWAFVFSRMERHLVRNPSATHLALLGTIVMAAPHWLWYGEKNIVNALIIWVVCSMIYRVLLLKRSHVTPRVEFESVSAARQNA